MRVTAFAPASIGNVSVGFDLLGAAMLPMDGTLLGDTLILSLSEQDVLTQSGRFAHRLPEDTRNNIVLRCLQVFRTRAQERQIVVPKVRIELVKDLPVGSGLGSSAASIVAAFSAFNALVDSPFDQAELLAMMGQAEGEISGSVHFDNVAPAYLGGLQLMKQDLQNPVSILPFSDDYYWLLCYPGIEMSTAKARAILPEQVPLVTAVKYAQQLAEFVDSCHRQHYSQALALINDVIAEPFRANILPGFSQAKIEMQNSGALACGISGSGPTLFAVFDDFEKAEQAQAWLSSHYIQHDSGFSHVCQLNKQGVTLSSE